MGGGDGEGVHRVWIVKGADERRRREVSRGRGGERRWGGGKGWNGKGLRKKAARGDK